MSSATLPIGPVGEAPASAPADPSLRFGPVRAAERVASVDVLRGVAVLGILAMNIYAFGHVFAAYTNPLLGGGTGRLDMATWWVTHLLFEMKFITIFSMLFGAGLSLMAERAAARGSRFGGFYYRRLFWLLVIGAIHGYLLWFGDILFWYAVCGLVLYPLRRLRPVTLVVAGLVVLSLVAPLMLGFGFFALPQMKAGAAEATKAREAGEPITPEQEQAIEMWESLHPGEEKMREETEAYRGGYLAQVAFRAPLVLQMQTTFLFLFGWRIVGVMMIGMGLLRMGILSAQRSSRFYGLCCLIGYGIGLPLVWWGARLMLAGGFDPIVLNQGAYLPNYFGSLGVALGHVGLVMLACKTGAVPWLTSRLAAVGRMALTNYLSHTVICTTLFYGWGLGLFGTLGRFELEMIVVAIWIFQLIVSPIWLRSFRFGPAEWLWRSLTYGQRQSMRAVLQESPA